MNTKRLRKHYSKLDKEQLIELLIRSREEIELLGDEKLQYRLIKRQKRYINRAIAFIDFYTQGRKYITENDKEIINILRTGRTGIWYETYKAQPKKNKGKN